MIVLFFYLLNIVFSKSAFTGGGIFFWQRQKSEKAKTLEICPSCSGKVGDAQFQKNSVSPPANTAY